MCNISLTNSTCEPRTTTLSLSVCVMSTVILASAVSVGTSANIGALCKIFSRYQQWRSKVPLIQLLLVSTVVSAILCPFEIVRIWLAWTNHDVILPCTIHHFLHLMAETCTFVTTLMITYERLQKIKNRYPIDAQMNPKRAVGLCSWLCITPVFLYLANRDNESNDFISVFCYVCFLNNKFVSTYMIPQIIASSFFSLSFILSFAMYAIGIRILWTSSLSAVSTMELNEGSNHFRPDLSHLNKVKRLSNPFRASDFSESKSKSQDDSHDALHIESFSSNTSPSKQSESSNPESTCLDVLSKDEIKRNIEKLEKLSNEFIEQSKMGSVFNDSKSDEDTDPSQLNPLRHIRRSAGNTWNFGVDSDTSSMSSKHSMPNRSSTRRKRLKKKRDKFKKQASVDSVGTASVLSEQSNIFANLDGTEIVKNWKDDSVRKSSAGNSNNQIPADPSQDKISIILEQPEYDKTSMKSNEGCIRESEGKIENFCPAEREKETSFSTNPLTTISSGCLSYTSDMKSGLSISSIENRQLSGMSPIDRLKSSKTRLIHVKSMECDFQRIKSRKRFLQYSKSLEMRRQESCFFWDDEDQKTPVKQSLKQRSKSFDINILRASTRDEMPVVKIQDIGALGVDLRKFHVTRLSSSMINLKTQEFTQKTTYSSSQTQTDNELFFPDNRYAEDLPEIRIIRPSVPSKHISPRRSQWSKPMNVRRILEDDITELSPNTENMRQRAMTMDSQYRRNALGTPTGHQATRKSTIQTIKRSVLIMVAFALAYFPVFLVTVLNLGSLISLQSLLDWYQFCKCIQYTYYAFVPIIYVYTNKGLVKTLNQAPRNFKF